MSMNLSSLIECSYGRCPTVESVKDYIAYTAKMGYKTLYLGLTDAYKIEGEPYFNYKRGGYTTADLQQIDKFAIEQGVEVIGCIQTLGHLKFLRRYEVYRDMYDTDEIMLADDPRVLALNDKMLSAISAGLSSRKILIGFDEAPETGTGRYKELHKGPNDRKVLLLRHMNKVVDMARRYGYTCEVWHDMLLDKGSSVLNADDVKRLLPKDVRVYLWDYDTNDETKLRALIDALHAHCSSFGYAGAALKECSFSVANAFSVSRLIPQMKVCMEKGITDFMVTTWTDCGGQCSLYAVFPALFVAAEYAGGRYAPGGELDKARFKEICGVSFDDMWSLGYLNDPFRKNLSTRTNHSRWILETDIFHGDFDKLLSPGTREKYFELAEVYDRAEAGVFAPIFKMQAAYARVLAIKSDVAGKIRAAYAAKDKAGLMRLRNEDMAQLITYLKTFIKVFNDTWRWDSLPFGLEYNQAMFGTALLRFEYICDRLTACAEQGEAIVELEGPSLMPSMRPGKDAEDTCFLSDIRLFMTAR